LDKHFHDDLTNRVFSSICQDREPTRKDLGELMSKYIEAMKHASLVAGEDLYELDWRPLDSRTIRYAVATDAIALLQDHSRLKRVSRCPGRGCGWLFLNTGGRAPPLVLDVHLRQPRQNAAAARTPQTTHRLSVADGRTAWPHRLASALMLWRRRSSRTPRRPPVPHGRQGRSACFPCASSRRRRP
jgi:hypothetical protein